jgi:hypothetical protein
MPQRAMLERPCDSGTDPSEFFPDYIDRELQPQSANPGSAGKLYGVRECNDQQHRVASIFSFSGPENVVLCAFRTLGRAPHDICL